jgi:hypothetical protein
MVTIMPTIISPPLIKSNIGIVFAEAFLPTIKTIIDIITAPLQKIFLELALQMAKSPFPLPPLGKQLRLIERPLHKLSGGLMRYLVKR